ncbi:unnamed protein product [Prorocentrum cordatum]|uniref:Uncharacterized protein n=1 Tax=Prorocentrum cordatum TaxID=2364126 RepID=A0ABN9QLS6_9DINO|nr:unnamed protein product [Polarella glacialis]
MTGAEFCASYPVAEVSGCDSRAPGACGQRLLQPGHGQAGTFELKSEMTAATVLANWTELQGAPTSTLSSVVIYVRRFDLDGPYLPYACHHQEGILVA